MNIASPFVTRPVMTTTVMVAILLFGTMSYRRMPVSDLPNVDFPTIQVSASLPGASPETMASSVATVLEREFSTISGIDSMNSASAQGSSQVTLQFNLDRDIDAAAQDVQAAISRAIRHLPPDMPTPPSFQKVNPADQPILFLALTSPTLPLSTLNDYGETLMAQRISMVDGVAQVQVYGGQKYAVRIELNPEALASRTIGIDEVIEAVQRANVNLPTGILHGPNRTFTVQANGQLMEAKAYRSIVVAYRNGNPVRLEDLGRVIDSVENNKVAAWYCTPTQQQRAIILAVQRQPGRNTIEVTRAVKSLLDSLREQLPASITLEELYDRSLMIHESTRDVQITLVLTLFLVIFVIFAFLRNASATLIPSLALPMSVIGTFIVMDALGYGLDNLSLMALTLAVGFVVDDAIVVLENIVRHMEMGKSKLQATLDGTREISFTIVSMTLSLAAVFIPVLFMGGIVGRLFREFAVTIGAAVIISGIISLSLTPMLASRFLKPPSEAHHGPIYIASDRVFQAMLDFYDRTLRWVLRRQRATMLFALIMLIVSFALFYIVPKGFLPSEDRGMLSAQTEALEGSSYESMFLHQKAVANVLQKDPNIAAFMSSAGARGSRGGNTGNCMIRLKPRAQRKLDADTLIQQLRPKLAAITGISTFLINPPPIQVGGRTTKSMYQFTLLGPDTDALYASANRLVDKMRREATFQDVTSDMQLKNPELDIVINRDLAATLGISASQIENALFSAYGDRQISSIFTPNDQYNVMISLLRKYQTDPEAVPLLYIRSGSGDLIPITAVAKLKRSYGPLIINHSGQLPSVTVSFNLSPGISIGQGVKIIDTLASDTLASSISSTFQGTAQAFQASMKGMGVLLILAIIVIYMVLAILYENFYHPITILSALPFAGVGALATLMLFRQELSLYAFIGIIMLVGLVKKNGIMMVDFALEAQRQNNASPVDAIHAACLIRFRPIMMTTMAALMAGIPIALGLGAGAEARRPLGLAVVGGLLFSQTLTLYVTPVFFVYMAKLQNKLRPYLGHHRPAGASDTAHTAKATP